MDYMDKNIPLISKVFEQSNTSQPFTLAAPTSSSLLELLNVIDWPEPPSVVSHVNFSTSPKNCHYHLLYPRDTYKVGEFLEVTITARDHNGQPKNYGGDFFQAKLYSSSMKAGVTGQVKDHGNGSYSATFLLAWPGEAQVHIRLIHSSEAVDVLKKKRESDPGKVYFNGYFHYNGSSAVAECNLQVAGNDVCSYVDPVSGDRWQCVRPQKMPCHSWVFHSMGGYRKVTNALEDSLLGNSVTDKTISGSVPTIDIKPDQRFSELHFKLPSCRPEQKSVQPSGFYYQDIWTSLVCQGLYFSQPSDALDCLKGKDIHMFGDSTLRQWFEYLERFIPSLKRIDLHVTYQSGPLIAVDADAGLVMRWRAHGLPIRTSKTMVADIHYEASHLAGIGGGPKTVIILTLWAHFTTYPVRVYIERLERVRQAIMSLLFRSPETTVIIKSANTGYKSIYGSDWLSLQLDMLLRAAFNGTGVIILDAWDMTSCHYLPDDIHPGPPVIKNEVDLMLSYICPHLPRRDISMTPPQPKVKVT
ncbi:NXPE family member 3-like [Hyla sarda]|uniref:NXPE family member 3-like n=1 Tax=Hyla sarda TaxID=327740 RepID=UPI0024C3A8FC|nr:NXPE family member 3-like [Hyla sarda]